VRGVSAASLEKARIVAEGSGKTHETSPENDFDAVDGCVTAPRIGDTMPDGTIYAGVSPDTGKAMYATPADASPDLHLQSGAEIRRQTRCPWLPGLAGADSSQNVPRSLRSHRLLGELNVLCNNRAAHRRI
jgi:hypothetical protein